MFAHTNAIRLPENYKSNLCYGCYALISTKIKDVAMLEGNLPKIISANLKRENTVNKADVNVTMASASAAATILNNGKEEEEEKKV